MALGDPLEAGIRDRQLREQQSMGFFQNALGLMQQEDQKQQSLEMLKQMGILVEEQPNLKDYEKLAKQNKATIVASPSLSEEEKLNQAKNLTKAFGLPQPKTGRWNIDVDKASKLGLGYDLNTGATTIKPTQQLPTLAQQITEIQALEEAKKRGDVSPNTQYSTGKSGLTLKSPTQKSGALAQLGIETENKGIEDIRTEIQTKNPALYKYLEKVGNNQLPVRGSFGMSYNQVTEIVSSLFPDKYDPTVYPAKEKMRTEFTAGKAGQNIRSLNTATEHLDELINAIPSLGNGNLMKANSIKNWTTRNLGKPGVARFNFIKAALSGELATLFKNSGGTDQEIDNIREAIDTADSPRNLYDTLKNGAIPLMKGRMGALDWQWKTAFGEEDSFPIMSKNTKEIFDKHSGQQYQEGQTATNPQTGEKLTYRGGKWQK